VVVCSLSQICGVRYEGFERAVDSVANHDASHLSFFSGCIRKGSADVYRVVLAYKDRTWLAELFPLDDEVPVLIEHLNPVVSAVGDVHPSAGTADEDVVRLVELARCRSLASPCLDEMAILRKLHHTARAVLIRRMTVGNKDVAVWRDCNAGRPVECIGTGSGDTGLTECH